MDDYYDMLGVDADASTDEIRAAYRELKQGLDSSTEDGAKTRKAKLNKAWNVLSDPYQRGRYDAELERGVIHDDVDDDDDVVSATGAQPKTRARAAQGQKERRQARQIGPPTIQPPAGLRYPQTKQRMIAMAIDLIVLLVLFVGSQFLVVSLQKSNEREAYDARRELVENKIPDAEDNVDAAKDELKKAQAATPIDQADVDAAQKKVDDAEKVKDDLNDDLSEAEKKLAPISQLISGIVFFLGFLYLVVPSMVTGATLGKRTQHLKVYREDGTPARNSDLIKRYGLLVLATYALSFVLGPIAAAIVLFVVTMWTRNPNQQGLHDRFCHTVVLTDAQ
jgi:curved DNA-binding protein CbpA